MPIGEMKMGKIVTPKWRVEVQDNTGVKNQFAWREGRPTLKALEAWRNGFNQSFKKDGVNYHLSKSLGFILCYGNCQIVEQRTGRVVVEYKAPMFEVA
jgi:hypothetical protein